MGWWRGSVVSSLAAVLACACATAPSPLVARAVPSEVTAPVEVQGHRGARAARPENTLAAFAHAIEAGADVLEMDLAVTADDRLAVVHDLQVNPERCLGPDGRPDSRRPAVRSLSLADLKRYDCGTLPHPAFPAQVAVPGQAIPSFEEVVALVKVSSFLAAPAVRLNVELKTVPGRPDLGPPAERLAALAADAIRASGLQDRITVQCFDHAVLRALHARLPSLSLSALLDQDRPADLAGVAREARAGTLSPHHEWITPADVRVLHGAGLRVVPWTANDPAAWERLLRMGVDGIITDDPAGLVAWLKAQGAR